MIIFEKEYDGESIVDLARDISESLEPEFNPIVAEVPQDEWGFHKGYFRVTIKWSGE